MSVVSSLPSRPSIVGTVIERRKKNEKDGGAPSVPASSSELAPQPAQGPTPASIVLVFPFSVYFRGAGEEEEEEEGTACLPTAAIDDG